MSKDTTEILENIKTTAEIHDIDSSSTELLKCLKMLQTRHSLNNETIVAMPHARDNSFVICAISNESGITRKMFKWSSPHTLEGQSLSVLVGLEACALKKRITFKTSDGYTLKLAVKDGVEVWTDGDLEFDDRDNHPIDVMDEKLEGEFI